LGKRSYQTEQSWREEYRGDQAAFAKEHSKHGVKFKDESPFTRSAASRVFLSDDG
jgi:hypothetical protein